jgi:hypothetical protein
MERQIYRGHMHSPPSFCSLVIIPEQSRHRYYRPLREHLVLSSADTFSLQHSVHEVLELVCSGGDIILDTTHFVVVVEEG